MAMNRIQFQRGLSMTEFLERYGTEEQCVAALEQARWPKGFVCPRCQGTSCSRIETRTHPLYQCSACRHQTSLIAGTVMQATKLPLTQWLLAIYLIGQAKSGISALTLGRYLGVSYPTAWLLHHKLMAAMAAREARYRLSGDIQVDDAYLGGELPGGKAGRGSENKAAFVAAISLEQGRPRYAKLTPVATFSLKEIGQWAGAHLAGGSTVFSDGLACFGAVTEAGCTHQPTVVGGRKPRELPQFKWINTTLGNLKMALSGSFHAFNFKKYASGYLAEFTYRFNRRFDLRTLPARLLVAAAGCGPRPERVIRMAEDAC